RGNVETSKRRNVQIQILYRSASSVSSVVNSSTNFFRSKSMSLRSMKKTRVRNRTALDPSVPLRSVSAVMTNVAATAADTIRLTFNVRALPGPLPRFTAGAGVAETVLSMSKVRDTVVELACTGSVQGT